MNSRQDNHLSMEIVTGDFLENTPPEVLVQLPEIEDLRENLLNNVGALQMLAGNQGVNITGNRMTKESIREEMTQRGFETAGDVCAYAIAIGDEVLQMKSTFVYSDFEKMRNNEIASVCLVIHNLALPIVSNLESYGTTVTSLSRLRDSILAYNQALPQTRNNIALRVTITERIEELFEENNQILFRIDKLVSRLKFREPTYYKDYFNVRKIVDTGSHKLSIKGKITNESGQPIDQVNVIVEAPKEATTKTTQLGNYQLKGVEAGVWPVTFKRDGYISERVFLVFTPNTRIDYNVTLKAVVEQERSA
jgi:hypothetical protein